MTRYSFLYYCKTYFQRFGPGTALFFAYFIIGRIELSIHPVAAFVTLLWLPAGIALAALVVYGYTLWPAVMLASFVIYFSADAAPLASFGVALGDTLQVVASTYFLKRYIGFNPNLLRLRDNVGLIAVALIAPVLGNAIGIAGLWLGGTLATGGIVSLWTQWWIEDALGILIIAPLLFEWVYVPLTRKSTMAPMQYLELCAVVIVVFFTSLFIFWTPQGHFAYYLFIPLTWAALRTGPRGTTLAIFTAASAAISAALAGQGPYAGQNLIYLQIFIGTMSIAFLILTAIVERQKRTQLLLGHHVDALEQALQKVSSEDEAKKDFLAILAHELRNPLSAIMSSAELLRLQEIHAPDTYALLQTIDEHVRTMTSMLDDLLDISRISKNKLTLRKETLSLDSLIDRSVRASQALVRSRSHTLAVIKPEHELYLEADPIRLEQIVVNLLNNAAKYTKPNGSIELVAKKEGNLAVIYVRDSGIGIPKNMLKRIFEPFFQVERGKLATEGLGVGLPLTRQLVEMHGGTIEARSQGEGHGSEFVVRLPLPVHMQPPPVVKPKSRIGRALHRVKNTRTILVVDDNEIAAEALGRLLQLRGHEVQIAHNGKEAIDQARRWHPQIIILDIGLPDIDGYEVARMLQGDKNFSSTLIALTGYGQPQDKERALEVGFDLHLTKPVGLKEIEAAFRKLPHVSHHSA
jgi:signal transduction histidine kinase/CheY-like chemotaxis protein